jgi:hypothetical protein
LHYGIDQGEKQLMPKKTIGAVIPSQSAIVAPIPSRCVPFLPKGVCAVAGETRVQRRNPS